jgi:hypothetical protein
LANDEGLQTRDKRRPKVFESDLRTRSALCGTGILLALILVVARQPLILLAVPAVMIFLGIAADMQELLAAWFGILNTAGIFDPEVLTDTERAVCAERRDYFWFGEVVSAAALAGAFTVPLGMSLTGKTGSLFSFTIAAMLFLLLFVFLPKLIRKAMMTDTDTIILLFGKNEQVKKVFWTVFIVLAGFVLAQVVDPATAQEIIRILTGTGV